jgi:oligoribonuclease
VADENTHGEQYAGTGEVVHHHSLVHYAKIYTWTLVSTIRTEQMTEHETLDKKKNLIWIDLEMTGLDTSNDQIIEIATIVTDSRLQEIAIGPELVLHQDESVMAAMDEWNTKQHGKSGLTKRVLASKTTVEEAEQETLNFLAKFVEQGASPMCGNSICQDRRFMARQMPRLEAFFHYRNLDVSTLKILAQSWASDVAKSFSKTSSHRALDDVRDSIAELTHYREHLFDQNVLKGNR